MRIRTSLLIAAATLCITYSMAARHASANPPIAVYGAVSREVIACQQKADFDHAMQLRASDGPEKAADYIISRFKVLDEHTKLPMCWYGNVGPVQFGESVDYGIQPAPDNTYTHFWGVNVGNSELGFWILWTEPTNEKGA